MSILDSVLILTILSLLAFFLSQYAYRHTNFDVETGKAENLLDYQRSNIDKRLSEQTATYISLEKESYSLLERRAEFGKLSEGIIHDIINPLTSVSLHLEKIATGHQQFVEIKKNIEAIGEVSRKMQHFMHSVKEMMGSQYLKDQKTTANMSVSLDTIANLFRYRMRMENVTFSFKGKRNIELPIHQMRLNQIFMNIISNSLESFELNQYRKNINISIRNNEKSETCIAIKDNGKGMDETQVSNIFQRSFSSKESGSGIGLMTVYDIVKKELKGTIAIKSSVGEGTTVEIRIPQYRHMV